MTLKYGRFLWVCNQKESVDCRGGVLGRRMRIAELPWRVHEGEPVPHVDQTIYERRLLLPMKLVVLRHIISI